MEALDEKIIYAIEHQKVYHAKIKRAYEKKVKPKKFHVEDLILKDNINNATTNDEVKGKFEPNWLGPYVIVHNTKLGAYKISIMYGKENPKTFNSRHLKCFYT